MPWFVAGSTGIAQMIETKCRDGQLVNLSYLNNWTFRYLYNQREHTTLALATHYQVALCTFVVYDKMKNSALGHRSHYLKSEPASLLENHFFVFRTFISLVKRPLCLFSQYSLNGYYALHRRTLRFLTSSNHPWNAYPRPFGKVCSLRNNTSRSKLSKVCFLASLTNWFCNCTTLNTFTWHADFWSSVGFYRIFYMAIFCRTAP